MERATWAGPDIDVSKPSAARIYDAHLGGFHNFQVDRDAAAQIVALMPELPDIMRANRSFLRRAVRHLAGLGVTQFLDLGSGIPTVGNVHEIAWKANPECRIVYVDVDPVAVSHSRNILGDTDRAAVVQGDLREPDHILAAPETQRLLDFEQPIAVLMFAVLHFVPDEDDPVGIIRSYLDPMVPGSHLALSHATLEGPEREKAEEATAHFQRSVTDFTMRTRAEIIALFDGLELLEPGVVYLPEWRPDAGDEVADARRFSQFAGVARKRQASAFSLAT